MNLQDGISYKVFPGGRGGRVLFYDTAGDIFAALICNGLGDRPFLVNAVRLDGNAKVYYQNGLGDRQARMLGVDGLGYIAEMDAAYAFAVKVGLVRERVAA